MTESPRTKLGSDEVHVWGVPTSDPPRPYGVLREILSPDERARAEGFHFEADRVRYVVARGSLRLLLGRYHRQDPSSLAFAYGKHGKPELGNPVDPEVVRFNVSHSGKWVLLGFTLGREVGVDVERIRPVPRLEKIAEERFTSAESRRLVGLPPDQRVRAFFSCWTRKEACLKALGTGLYARLDEVVVPPSAMVTPLQGVEDVPHRAGSWSVWGLVPARGYLGAVAVAHGTPRLLPGMWAGSTGMGFWPDLEGP